MNEITLIFNRQMKMSDLIDSDYRLLLLLNKLDIKLGFGEKSVELVCREAKFDADCFIFLAQLHTRRLGEERSERFENLFIEPFLTYLKNSHSYFLKYRLPNIRRKLEMIYTDQEQSMRDLVLRFFDGYLHEVTEHMKYEDEVVFPYIRSLIENSCLEKYSINIFEARHNDIEEKMVDLKQILMKYLPSVKDQNLITNILIELYLTQEELEIHTYIEDELVIPRVKKLEKQN